MVEDGTLRRDKGRIRERSAEVLHNHPEHEISHT